MVELKKDWDSCCFRAQKREICSATLSNTSEKATGSDTRTMLSSDFMLIESRVSSSSYLGRSVRAQAPKLARSSRPQTGQKQDFHANHFSSPDQKCIEPSTHHSMMTPTNWEVPMLRRKSIPGWKVNQTRDESVGSGQYHNWINVPCCSPNNDAHTTRLSLCEDKWQKLLIPQPSIVGFRCIVFVIFDLQSPMIAAMWCACPKSARDSGNRPQSIVEKAANLFSDGTSSCANNRKYFHRPIIPASIFIVLYNKVTWKGCNAARNIEFYRVFDWLSSCTAGR